MSLMLDAADRLAPVEGSPSVCSCWDCRHPRPDNVDVRTLHAERRVEFAEWLGVNRPVTGVRDLPGWRKRQVRWQEIDPDCAPISSGACHMSDHASMPAHPANHR